MCTDPKKLDKLNSSYINTIRTVIIQPKEFGFPISERTYHCECCGLEIDRDYNASINILRKGLEILKEQDRDYPKSLVNICG